MSRLILLKKPIIIFFSIIAFWVAFLPIYFTPYMLAEAIRQSGVKHDWVPFSEIPEIMSASVIASEDSGFCDHHGVEWKITWQVIKDDQNRGASTITQQTTKNLFLWQGRGPLVYLRKAIEIPLATIIDAFYSKRRIMEIYLNSIEYDTGVFGIEAAAAHHFNKPARELTAYEAALMAAVLPAPKTYQAAPPSAYIAKRAHKIQREANDVMQIGLNHCLS